MSLLKGTYYWASTEGTRLKVGQMQGSVILSTALFFVIWQSPVRRWRRHGERVMATRDLALVLAPSIPAPIARRH